MRFIRNTVFAAAFVTAACASSGSSIDTDGVISSAGSDAYTKDVGLATASDFRRFATRILERYQYEIERFDEGAYSFVDTRWKDRPVLDDELALGYGAAETRILLRTRVRSRATTLVLAVHRITFMAENRLKRAGSTEWEQGVMTDEFEDYASRIALQFETEFRAGLRRGG